MKSISEYNEAILKDRIKALEEIVTVIDNAKEKAEAYNIFETLLEDPVINDVKDSPLYGVPYTLKDNFSTKGILTTASSNTLRDYIPVYNATVYQKLLDAGSILIGKTTMDELALGGSGETCHNGPVKNAINPELISGGSSSGSAVSVALGLAAFSIGSDTGDSVRKPAAYNGIVGYKPSYGLVSRYGLFPFASSLDTVGVLTNNVLDAAKVINIIKGKDENDMTSVDSSDMDLVSEIDTVKTKNLFYIKELVDMASFEDVTDNNYLVDLMSEYSKLVNHLKEEGYTLTPVSMDKEILKAMFPTYLMISCSEATSNCSNLTGIIFGPRQNEGSINDIIKNFRKDNFCSLIKRRFIIGSYALNKENQEKYFLNAKRVRRIIVDSLNEAFSKYDGLLMPVGNGYIKKINEDYVIEDKMEEALDNNLLFGNFGGYPSITIPLKNKGEFPYSVSLTFDIYKDKELLSTAKDIENIIERGKENV